MDIHFIFQVPLSKVLSLDTEAEGDLQKLKTWGSLHAVKLRHGKGEAVDANCLSKLYNEWQQTRHDLRRHLKSRLQGVLGGGMAALQEAKSIRTALHAIDRGIKDLAQQRRKLREQGFPNPTSAEMGPEFMHRAIQQAAIRETLIQQRGAFYIGFYQSLIQLPSLAACLKGGWPIYPGLDKHGKLVECHRSRDLTIKPAPKGIKIALDCLRQIEREIDLYAVHLTPHPMTDEQWKLFKWERLQKALEALQCSSLDCHRPAMYVGEHQEMTCANHLKKTAHAKFPIELSWLADFHGTLKRLQTTA